MPVSFPLHPNIIYCQHRFENSLCLELGLLLEELVVHSQQAHRLSSVTTTVNEGLLGRDDGAIFDHHAVVDYHLRLASLQTGWCNYIGASCLGLYSEDLGEGVENVMKYEVYKCNII